MVKTRVAVHLIIDSRVVFLFSRTEQMRPVINTNRYLLQSTLPESARDICLVEAASSHLLKMSSNFNRLIGSHKFPGAIPGASSMTRSKVLTPRLQVSSSMDQRRYREDRYRSPVDQLLYVDTTPQHLDIHSQAN